MYAQRTMVANFDNIYAYSNWKIINIGGQTDGQMWSKLASHANARKIHMWQPRKKNLQGKISVALNQSG